MLIFFLVCVLKATINVLIFPTWQNPSNASQKLDSSVPRRDCQQEQLWFTWSPTTTDLMAAKEIQTQSSVTADIKAGMPHLDPEFALPAGANPLT